MNKKVLIALITSFLLLVGAAFAYPMIKASIIKSDPINYLLYASAKSSRDTVDMSVNSKMAFDDTLLADMASNSEDPKAMTEFIKNIADEISFNARVKLGMDLGKGQMNFQENFALKYGENSFLTMNLGYLEGDGFISMPELYNKSFYINKDQVTQFIEEQSGLSFEGFKLSNYTKHLDIQGTQEYKEMIKNVKIYEAPFRTMLSDLKKGEDITVTTADGKNYKCDTLTLDLDMKKFMQGYTELAKVAKTDENLKVLSKSVLINLLNELKSTGDYTKFNIDESELNAGIEELEKNYNDMWTQGLDAYIELFEEGLNNFEALPEDTTMNLTIAIDKKYTIRQYTITTKAPGLTINQEMTINNIGKQVAFDKPKSDDSVLLMDLIKTPEEMEKIYQSVMNDNIPAFLKSENFKKITDDIKVKAENLPASERDMIKTTLDGLADSYAMFSAFMPNPFAQTPEFDYDDGSYDSEPIETAPVGDAQNGFFEIPVGFSSSTAEFGIAFVDPENGDRVNAFVYDMEGITLEELAQIEADALKEDFPDADVTPTETYFAGYPAFELFLEDGDTFRNYFIFEDDNGVKRSIQIIASFESWIDLYTAINDSFNVE